VFVLILNTCRQILNKMKFLYMYNIPFFLHSYP